MASFIPRYQKKHLQLKQREGELMALLQGAAKIEIIMDAVEQVRHSRIRALKEKMAKLLPTEVNTSQVDQWQKQIVDLQTIAATAILEEYRQKLTRLKEAVSILRPPRRGDW